MKIAAVPARAVRAGNRRRRPARRQQREGLDRGGYGDGTNRRVFVAAGKRQQRQRDRARRREIIKEASFERTSI